MTTATDRKEPNFDECRRHLAYHEAGHWIVTKAAGFKVGDITLKVDRVLVGVKKNKSAFYGSGSSHIDPEPILKSITDVEDYLLNRMAVLTAGISAQKIVDERDIEYLWNEQAADDRTKLNELSFILRGIRFSDEITKETELLHRLALGNEAGKLAKKLLDENQVALEAISSFLIKRVRNTNIEFVVPAKDLEEVFKLANE